MVGQLLLQSHLLPIESVALGRFVVDMAYPQRRFHDPILDQPPQSTRYEQHDFQEHAKQHKSISTGSRLTELLEVFRGVEASLESHVRATASITYELSQWDSVFKDACAIPTSRKWIEDAIEDGQDIFFVVGFRTFVNLNSSESVSKSSTKGGDVQLPVSLVLQANVPGLALGGAMDPGISGSKMRTRHNTRSYERDGEMIYAVQYCKVLFKWYSSRKVETSSLGKTRWRVHWAIRTLDVSTEDDVLEAGLEEET